MFEPVWNSPEMSGAAWTSLEKTFEARHMWNTHLDMLGNASTYLEQFGKILECLGNIETILKCFEMSGKAWRCLKMPASVQTSLGEYGTLRNNLENCMNNLGKAGKVWGRAGVLNINKWMV